ADAPHEEVRPRQTRPAQASPVERRPVTTEPHPMQDEPALLARLDQYRSYLRVLARMQLGARGKGKLDPSDVVQQTLVQAVAAAAQVRGENEAELAGWLRQILAHTLANALRDLHRDRRDVDRERSLDAELNDSSARLAALLAAPDSSPSVRAERNEQLLLLATAIEELPEAQRDAVIPHHLQGQTLDPLSLHPT